jgi:hypothetical protein
LPTGRSPARLPELGRTGPARRCPNATRERSGARAQARGPTDPTRYPGRLPKEDLHLVHSQDFAKPDRTGAQTYPAMNPDPGKSLRRGDPGMLWADWPLIAPAAQAARLAGLRRLMWARECGRLQVVTSVPGRPSISHARSRDPPRTPRWASAPPAPAWTGGAETSGRCACPRDRGPDSPRSPLPHSGTP